MKINGLIDKPLWYDIKCKCNHDSVETEFPIAECLHCQFQQQENSIPRKDFEINNDIVENDKEGKPKIIKKQNKTITEITIVRGKKYQEIIGWTF